MPRRPLEISCNVLLVIPSGINFEKGNHHKCTNYNSVKFTRSLCGRDRKMNDKLLCNIIQRDIKSYFRVQGVGEQISYPYRVLSDHD